MKLSKLLEGMQITKNTVAGDPEIGEVRYDSRAVQPGDLFVAVRGFETDGHKYIQSALERVRQPWYARKREKAFRLYLPKIPAGRWR